jgi:hypothetical protein
MGLTGIDPIVEVTLHAEGRSITSLISEQKINAEEISEERLSKVIRIFI